MFSMANLDVIMGYRFDAHRLLVLNEVHNAGSIAAAARSLGYSEATLAHHLRVLQSQAGVPLTTRVGRTTRLTAAGQALARRGHIIAQQLAAADHDIAHHGDLTTGTLRIAAFPSYCANTLPEQLGAFTTRYPGVAIELVEAEPGEALQVLASDRCDLAIIFIDPAKPPDLDGRSTHRLHDDPIRVVLPRRHPLATQPTIRIGQLANDTWIAGCTRCQDHLKRIAAEAGFVPNISFATDDYLAVQRFVANNLGVTLLPQIALDNSPQTTDITTANLDPPEHRTILAVTNPQPPLPANAITQQLTRHG